MRLTNDENNGNLVLSGEKRKRLEVFMDPQFPRMAFFTSDGEVVMLLPPPQ
ncbi:MAG: hypothetical protein IH851_08665 [Armatimonadetes bacterium]|nr:hypothetical protein [Armatimonadota bacterium]